MTVELSRRWSASVDIISIDPRRQGMVVMHKYANYFRVVANNVIGSLGNTFRVVDRLRSCVDLLEEIGALWGSTKGRIAEDYSVTDSRCIIQ